MVPPTTAGPTVASPTPPPTTPTAAPLAGILSPCSSDNQCPAQASCRVRYPDGQLCICNDGFMASSNFASCERAVYVNEVCITACAGLFTVCNAVSRRCECLAGYVLAGDNQNCVLPGRGLLEEACGNGCVFTSEQECVDGVCRCVSNLRPLTPEEIRAFSNPQRQCISWTYTLDGSFFTLAMTTTTTTTLSSTQTTKNSAVATLSIMSACQADIECPGHASCNVRYPSGQVCYCDENYLASTNLAVCEPVVYFNEFCITSCYGWHTVCDTLTKRCVCLPGYSLSSDGINCVLPGKALLDEACREGCFFEREQFCLDGTCKCMSGLRPMTDEEIRAFNNPDHQCIEESFSLAPLRLYSSCSHEGQCPTHASCKYRFPRGQVCYCDTGYVSSLDALQCEPVARLSEACITRCGGFFTTCDSSTRLCTCLPGYVPSSDGMNCVRTGLPLLGGLCLTSCLLSDEQRCVNGRCECIETMRPATDEERQAFNNETFQCRPILYSLVPLYSSCSCGCQCPSHASCKSRYPEGSVCYCDAGYVSSLDGTSCEPVARLSEACITRCGGFFTTCDSSTRLCTCLPGYIPSADGMNCLRTGLPLLGGLCLTSCLLSDEQRCVNGRCECIETMRPATDEERQAFNNRNFQCLPTGYALGGIRLFQTCVYDSQCPCHASCLERRPDGKICYCNSGYMASDDHYSCLPVSYYGQICVSRCAGLYMRCDVTTHRCVCNTGYSVTADGRNCVPLETALLGGSCNLNTACHFAEEQSCVNDSCVCRSGLRSSTYEEIRAFDNEYPQCRALTYALRTLALFATCSYDGQCPTGARCLERRPNGRICYCGSGHMASLDGLACLQAAYYGQACESRCAGLYMVCDPNTQRCVCNAGSHLAEDGRNCVPDGFVLLGGSCPTNRCLFGSEQECVNGRCTCNSGLRPTLGEEIRAFNNELPQCRMDSYYLVTTALFAACAHDSQCPYHASCRERRPDGRICYPDAGYVASLDGFSSIRAAYYGQNCVSTCAGLFMHCDVMRRVCVCNTGSDLAADGRNCVPDGSALLGGVCSVRSCHYSNEQECVNGICTCRSGLRPTTQEEIRAFNGEVPQCRDVGYYLTIRQLFSSCTSDDQCPFQASCLERRPNGRICYCNNGYMASTDRYQCIQAAYYGQPCVTRCAGLYMHCDTTQGGCICDAGTNLASDRRNCVPLGSALLGGSCSVNTCLFATTQECVDGTCVCRSGLRPITEEEIRAFNNELPQCRINSYYLRTTLLYTPCSYDSQCPYHASCLERRPDGKICYPDPGYMASLDSYTAIRAAYYGQNCLTSCAGLFMHCDALSLRCVCNSGCSLAADGRNCVPDGFALLGGSCLFNACQYSDEQVCVNGRCTCRDGLRATTLEEIRAFNNDLPQCRSSGYYLRSTMLFSSCLSDAECPEGAACMERRPNGKICYCKAELMAAANNLTCETAAYFGDVCTSDCAGLYLSCSAETLRCVCSDGSHLASDMKNCVPNGFALLGERCNSTTRCNYASEQNCVQEICTCKIGLRETTDDETRAFNNLAPQCRSTSYYLGTLSLFSPCSHESQCPTHASCLERRPDGRICYCNIGYIASDDSLNCIAAAYYGQFCLSRCAGLYMRCDPNTQRCVCNSGCHLAADGRNCVPDGSALLGGSCLEASCNYAEEQMCVNGVCTCKDGLRRATREEIRAFNTPIPQCRNRAYFLRTLALFSRCVSDGQCPGNGSCVERRPNERICICNSGYMASDDNTACITAAYYGDPCESRCAGLYMNCDTDTKRCFCNSGFHLAADGRNCVRIGFSLLNGRCNVTEDCHDPRDKECSNGVCVCREDLRPSTEFEIRAFNSELPQCRNSYSAGLVELFSSCTYDWDCPSNASCKERSPNGTICYCNAGFVSSLDSTTCEVAAYYNDNCITRCAGMFTTCDTATKRCVCNPGYYRGNDGLNCVLPGLDLLGQACSRSCQLFNEQSCVNNVCFCNAGLRPMTSEELRAFDYGGQCIAETYFLTHSVLFGVCFYDAQCPENARCRLRGCDGHLCMCSAGYTPSIDYLTCEKDAFYEEPCVTRCAGANMVCDDLTKTCRCLPGMLPNSNGKHCTPENRPLLGEICDMGKDNCYLQDEQACVNGRCACRNGSRRATCDEILAFNDTVSQCRSEDYSLDFCANVTTTTTPYTWPTIWTRGSVSLYGLCLWDYQCPSYAACKPRDCTGNVCYCNVGYVASLDLKSCERAAYYNETCVTRCAGLFMSCNQDTKTCECDQGFLPGCDGTFCEKPGLPLLGERCLDTCHMSGEQECTNGRCACRENLRRATDEEIRAFHNETLQCVFSNFTLGACGPWSPKLPKSTIVLKGESFIPHEILWPAVAGFLCLCFAVFILAAGCRWLRASRKRSAAPASSKGELSVDDEDGTFSLPRPDVWHQGFYRGDRSWASVPEDRFGRSAFPYGTGYFSTASTESTDDA